MKDALQKRAALCLKACDGLTIKELVNDQLYIGSTKWDYRVMRRAMEWWRTRCRETQALLNEAVQVSRAQAANFTAMKRRAERNGPVAKKIFNLCRERNARIECLAHRAETAEAKLQAAEEALRRCQSLFQNIHDYGAMGHPNDWAKVQSVWDMVNAALSTAPTPQPKVRIA